MAQRKLLLMGSFYSYKSCAASDKSQTLDHRSLLSYCIICAFACIQDEGGAQQDGAKRSKQKAAEAAAEQRSQLQRMMEEYYKLDYESNVGKLRTVQCFDGMWMI